MHGLERILSLEYANFGCKIRTAYCAVFVLVLTSVRPIGDVHAYKGKLCPTAATSSTIMRLLWETLTGRRLSVSNQHYSFGFRPPGLGIVIPWTGYGRWLTGSTATDANNK